MKKMTLKVALLSAIVMAVPGIALADYDADRKAAVAAVDKAKKVGGEWRDTRWKKAAAVKVKGADGKAKKMSYLAAADHYHKAGDSKNAMKYLDIVKFQGEMGYKQAMEQKNAGPRH